MNVVVEQIAGWGASGMGAGVGFFAVRWVAVFVSGRWDKREAHIDATNRELIENQRKLITQMQEQVDRLTLSDKAHGERLSHAEAALRECQTKHAASEIEIAQLRAEIKQKG